MIGYFVLGGALVAGTVALAVGVPRLFADGEDDPGAIAGARGQIALTSHHDVVVMNADGTDRRQLTDHPDWSWAPSWSPDGGKIVFVRGGEYTQIYVMNADGSGETPLTNRRRRHEDPAWSPDGTTIAFSAGAQFGEPGPPDSIFVMNADGTGRTRLTYGFSPAWSPDGTKLAFVSRRLGGGWTSW